MEKIGVNEFSWKKKPGIIEVHIFFVKKFSGQPKETEEMKPEWFDVDKIPFDRMWPDDKYWLPFLLAGKKFKGEFLFDQNDRVLNYNLQKIKEI
jgi:8-oxo-dGTP diphosphatase/2-hydroxy-dATP diphosphatase